MKRKLISKKELDKLRKNNIIVKNLIIEKDSYIKNFCKKNISSDVKYIHDHFFKKSLLYKNLFPTLSINNKIKSDIIKHHIIKKKIGQLELEVCVIPQGVYLFKGTNNFIHSSLPTLNLDICWFGTLSTAILYANRYFGGINVYKVKKEINLLLLNYNNLKVLFDNSETKCKKIICLKFGIFCSLTDQVKMILSLNPKWNNEIWLLSQIELDKDSYKYYRYEHRIHYYGNGYNDRLFAKELSKLISNELDGWFAYPSLTPFFDSGKLSSEVALFNFSKIERDVNSQFDWMQWTKNFSIKILDTSKLIITNRKLAFNFNAQRYFIENSKKYNLQNRDIITFNTHGLNPINLLQTPMEMIKFIKKLYKSCKILVLQEVPLINLTDIKKLGYCISCPNGSINKSLQLCVLTHKKIYLKKAVILKYKVRNGIHRNSIWLPKLSLVAIHIDVGYRYNNISYTNTNNLQNVYNKNLKIWKDSINYIMHNALSPKIIVGDFNFDFKHFAIDILPDKFHTSIYQILKNIKYTCIYRIVVDGIVTTHSIKQKTIPWAISDHIAVAGNFVK